MRPLDFYPSPSMQSMQPAQQYPYNSNGQQHASEAYRASPQQHPSSTSHAPLLPPIQNFEGQQNTMQSHPQFAPLPMNGAQMSPHPPPYPPNQFHYPNGGMQSAPMSSNVGANGQNGMMRFPIPPQGPMPMTPGRGKTKEVKRSNTLRPNSILARLLMLDRNEDWMLNVSKTQNKGA